MRGHPQAAPEAILQGRYVAARIADARRSPRGRAAPFRYADRGNMTAIGRSKAVADLHWCRLSGPLAWLVRLVVHLMGLVSHENRAPVFLPWAWNCFTRNRNARRITGVPSDAGLPDAPAVEEVLVHQRHDPPTRRLQGVPIDTRSGARLVIDASCRFCRRWGNRLARFSGIPDAPFPTTSAVCPWMTTRECAQGLILVRHDGTMYRGAAAVMKAIAQRKGFAWIDRMYESLPAFKYVSDRLYGWVSARRHRL
ncbi:MAG TPA: hypothetical protein DCM87_07975 [Planctomycetes bacterium]|nr:hypothetical protein [Planctomycetota bacterium]